MNTTFPERDRWPSLSCSTAVVKRFVRHLTLLVPQLLLLLLLLLLLYKAVIVVVVLVVVVVVVLRC
jgi:hypothetical protein